MIILLASASVCKLEPKDLESEQEVDEMNARVGIHETGSHLIKQKGGFMQQDEEKEIRGEMDESRPWRPVMCSELSACRRRPSHKKTREGMLEKGESIQAKRTCRTL